MTELVGLAMGIRRWERDSENDSLGPLFADFIPNIRQPPSAGISKTSRNHDKSDIHSNHRTAKEFLCNNHDEL